MSGVCAAVVVTSVASVSCGAGQPALAPDKRDIRVVAKAIEARLALLRDGAGEPAAGAWRIEVAELLLAELSLDATDSVVLVGAPTVAQRAHAQRAAQDALAQLNRADVAITSGEIALKNRPEYSKNDRLRAFARRLANEYAGFRAPMARGRALLILAALETEGEARQVDRASAAQRALASLKIPAGPTEARRLVMLGLAELYGAQRFAPPDEPLVSTLPQDIPVWFDIAQTLAASRPFWRLPAREHMEATLGKSLSTALAGRASKARLALQNAFSQWPATGENHSRNPVWTLLVADALYRIGLIEASSAAGPSSRRRALAQGCEAYAWLMSFDRLGNYAQDKLMSIVFGKILVFQKDRQWRDAASESPLVRVARAMQALRNGDESGVRDETHALAALASLPDDEIGGSRAIVSRALAKMRTAFAQAEDDPPDQ